MTSGESLRTVRPQDDLQSKSNSAVTSHDGEGQGANLNEVQCGILCSLQLWKSIHWRDSEETGDKKEGTWGCVQEGDN